MPTKLDFHIGRCQVCDGPLDPSDDVGQGVCFGCRAQLKIGPTVKRADGSKVRYAPGYSAQAAQYEENRKAKLRPLTEGEVSFKLEIEPEDCPVRGHFDSGEAELDRQDEDRILARLERGEDWAWCTVKVTASWGSFEGEDYLGCCSYENEADFTQLGGYFEDMKHEALADLNTKLEAVFSSVLSLVTP